LGAAAESSSASDIESALTEEMRVSTTDYDAVGGIVELTAGEGVMDYIASASTRSAVPPPLNGAGWDRRTSIGADQSLHIDQVSFKDAVTIGASSANSSFVTDAKRFDQKRPSESVGSPHQPLYFDGASEGTTILPQGEELVMVKSRLRAQEDQVSQLERQLKFVSTRRSEENKEFTEEIIRMEKESVTLKKKVKEWAAENEKQRVELIALQEKLDTQPPLVVEPLSATKDEDLEQKTKDLETELQALEIELSQRDVEIASCRMSDANSTEQVIKLKESNVQLKATLMDNSERHAREATALNSKIITLSDKVSSLDKTVSDITSQRHALQVRLNTCESDLTASVSKVSLLDKQLYNVTTERDSLKLQLTSCSSDLEIAAAKLSELAATSTSQRSSTTNRTAESNNKNKDADGGHDSITTTSITALPPAHHHHDEEDEPSPPIIKVQSPVSPSSHSSFPSATTTTTRAISPSAVPPIIMAAPGVAVGTGGGSLGDTGRAGDVHRSASSLSSTTRSQSRSKQYYEQEW